MKKPKYYQLIISGIVLLSTGFAPAALGASTQVSEQVGNGLLALSAPSTASLSSTLVNFSGPTAATGSLGQIEADDGRGTYVGWSLTATTSNFVHIGQPIQTSGPATTISAGGSYNGAAGGAYTLTITQAGPRGTAQFSVSGLESQSAITIPSVDTDLAIGTHGVLADFPSGTYQMGESWRVPIAVIPASNLTLQPSAASARYGDLTSVHSGIAHSFSGTADSATIMNADIGYGTGAYLNTPTLNLQVPPLSTSGYYFATITETLN